LEGARGLKLVACHHPLVDADTEGSGSTRGGGRALAALAAAGVDAVLSGHVHDPFDRMVQTEGGRSASSARARFPTHARHRAGL
jgi:hypothetical protein